MCIRDSLKSLTDIYKLNGYDFYLVGGAVRDGILDIPTKDFDFTTSAPPEESIKMLNDAGYKTTKVGIALEPLSYNLKKTQFTLQLTGKIHTKILQETHL